MTVKFASATVGTTATSLMTNATRRFKGDFGKHQMTITNEGAATIYLGDASVTTSLYGAKIAAAGTLQVTVSSNDLIYAIVATGTCVTRVLHVGL